MKMNFVHLGVKILKFYSEHPEKNLLRRKTARDFYFLALPRLIKHLICTIRLRAFSRLRLIRIDRECALLVLADVDILEFISLLSKRRVEPDPILVG